MNSTGLRIYVFLMMGIILSGIVTVMCLTKSINLENFYDVGAVYDVSDTEFELPGTNWNYDYEKKLIITQAENAYCTYNVKHSRKNWGFLYLSIRDLNGNTPAEIDFLGEEEEYFAAAGGCRLFFSFYCAESCFFCNTGNAVPGERREYCVGSGAGSFCNGVFVLFSGNGAGIDFDAPSSGTRAFF